MKISLVNNRNFLQYILINLSNYDVSLLLVYYFKYHNKFTISIFFHSPKKKEIIEIIPKYNVTLKKYCFTCFFVIRSNYI